SFRHVAQISTQSGKLWCCHAPGGDCKELLGQGIILSGWYTLYPQDCQPLWVLCNMHTDRGGWIVSEAHGRSRGEEGSTSGDPPTFRKGGCGERKPLILGACPAGRLRARLSPAGLPKAAGWLGGFFADYRKGFGSKLSELWLGNEHLHLLTSLGENKLCIDFMDFENQHSFAKYGSFQVAKESNWYQLTLGNFTGGSAGDSLSHHNHMPFSTQERKPDTQKFNCAETYKGAWWYNDCHDSNLNRKYWLGDHQSFADGINWRTERGYHCSYKHTEMKIKLRGLLQHTGISSEGSKGHLVHPLHF
ncbi:putative Ficolin 3 protein, partial [Naja naja]